MVTAKTAMLNNLTPHDLPSPPEVAIRIVRVAADPDISARDLQKIVSGDAALMAELLRIANSPFFGYRQTVTRVEQALVVLGQKMLRNIALLFIARETLRSGPTTQFDAQTCWENSLRRGVSARLLAEVVGADPEDAFTVGMLHDMGLLALFVAYPQAASTCHELALCNPEQRRRKEREMFTLSHEEVARMLMESWGLPEEIILPLAHHHDVFLDDMSPKIKKTCLLVLCAEWMTAVYSAADKRLALVHTRHLLSEYFGLDRRASDELLAQVPDAVTEAAGALGVQIEPQLPFEDVIQHANRRLIEQHQDREELVENLEVALAQREQLAEELQQAYGRLAQQAYFDPLTSLVNRRRFDEIFLGEVARHGRSANSLSLMILDLDGFKAINDGYGHLMGDTVLQGVAQTVRNTLRNSDVAARLGGDEMCLLLPETDVTGGGVAAERVRGAIEALHFNSEAIRVTSSIGGTTWQGQDVMRSSEIEQVRGNLLSTADEALYVAKKNGRNRVHWGSPN